MGYGNVFLLLNMKLKRDGKGIKRDKKGRFARGTVPPLKALGKMPLWWKQKDSAGKKEYYLENPSAKKKIFEQKRKYFAIKENREKARKIRLEFLKRNPYFRIIARENALRFYREYPDASMRNAKLGKEYWKIESRRKRRSKEMKEFWTAGKRNRQSILKKRQYRVNPELGKKIDRTVTAWWKDNPQARKNLSMKIRDFFIRNPKAFEEFLKHGKNPLKRHLKTPQRFLVRSRGEKAISNFLHKSNIPCLYESISLMITTNPFKGNICTPDFYIPSLNIFVEFYGGYPQAWKKKVLKNKIYSLHHIPVLGITPAELENLDYYLLRQGKQLSETRVAREFKIRKWIK